MKVYVYPADEHGCGCYRLIWPAQEMRKIGIDVEVVMPNERNNLTGVVENDRLVDASVPADADVIVLQRVSHVYLSQAVSILRQKRIGVVVDMDDDLAHIHPKNPAWVNFHPTSGKPGSVTSQHNWHNAQFACDNATVVTVSSDRLLKQYARKSHGIVLRNCVPESYFDVPHVDSATFGWAGSLASHPTDLQELGTAVAQLTREGWPFRIVGDPGGIKEQLGLDVNPEASGIVPISMWPHAISKLGVGVAPLDDTVFNAAKSWLKPLEMSAVGVPIIMSPRHEYEQFGKMFGIERFARKPSMWLRELRTLLRSESLRIELGEKNRAAVRHWTYTQQIHRWIAAWTLAYDRR